MADDLSLTAKLAQEAERVTSSLTETQYTGEGYIRQGWRQIYRLSDVVLVVADVRHSQALVQAPGLNS